MASIAVRGMANVKQPLLLTVTAAVAAVVLLRQHLGSRKLECFRIYWVVVKEL